MRLRAPYFLSLLVLFVAPLCNAIFADEAYQVDFHHALLGIPQARTTFFHRPSAASKASLLYTLSDRQILGAVNPKDGTVIWRQRLEDPDFNGTSQSLLKADERGNTLITSIGRKVQAWGAGDGKLVWEYLTSGQVHSLDTYQQNGDVIAVSEGDGAVIHVQTLAAGNGQVLWDFIDHTSVAQIRAASIECPG